MAKKEILIVAGLVLILAGLNTVNYVRGKNIRNSMTVTVKEGRLQVSVNLAEPAELEELPGIGPVIAQRIVAYRDANGGIKSLDDLKNIKGISNKVLTKMLPFIKL